MQRFYCNIGVKDPAPIHLTLGSKNVPIQLSVSFRPSVSEEIVHVQRKLTPAMTCTSKRAEPRLPSVAVDRAIMWHSELIPRDVERTVEYAKNINISVVLHEIGDSVMPVEQDADVSLRELVAVPDLWKRSENLRPFVNALNRPSCSLGIIRGDVLENVLKPSSSFVGPRYECHERMRRPISSFEIVRFASESASPRSTIT